MLLIFLLCQEIFLKMHLYFKHLGIMTRNGAYETTVKKIVFCSGYHEYRPALM